VKIMCLDKNVNGDVERTIEALASCSILVTFSKVPTLSGLQFFHMLSMQVGSHDV
jgi:hypothetical protein